MLNGGGFSYNRFVCSTCFITYKEVLNGFQMITQTIAWFCLWPSKIQTSTPQHCTLRQGSVLQPQQQQRASRWNSASRHQASIIWQINVTLTALLWYPNKSNSKNILHGFFSEQRWNLTDILYVTEICEKALLYPVSYTHLTLPTILRV